jgi:putative membrane protein
MLPRSERIKELLQFGRPFTNRDKLILRDHLALERTRLANERTFMAYIRSALYLIVGGLALMELHGPANLQWVGITALVLAAAFGVIGIVRFSQLKKQLQSYYAPLEAETTDDLNDE